MPVAELILGDNRNALAPGELIRSITLSGKALRSRTAFRRQSLTTLGRSAALLIGRRDSEFTLTVTAATARPVVLRFSSVPTETELSQALEAAVPDDLYHRDVHGSPLWKRHLTRRFAEEIRQELA